MPDAATHGAGYAGKIRNHMSCLFSHCIRHKLYRQMDPITEVRAPAASQYVKQSIRNWRKYRPFS